MRQNNCLKLAKERDTYKRHAEGMEKRASFILQHQAELERRLELAINTLRYYESVYPGDNAATLILAKLAATIVSE